MPRSQSFYGPYPFPDHGHALLFGTGSVQMQDESEIALLLTLGPGEGSVCFAASPDWRSQVLAAEDVLATPWAASLERTRATLPESGDGIDTHAWPGPPTAWRCSRASMAASWQGTTV